MKVVPKVFRRLLLIGFMGFFPWGTLVAQETPETPSQKMKDAVDKISQTPALIGKNLQSLREAATTKLRQSLGGKPAADAKDDPGNGSQTEKKDIPSIAERFSPAGRRDPFRPMTLRTKTNDQPRENLSPLERFELGQLKVVGIVWDLKEPRAMIEDTAGLGYIVKVGTPIGNNEGKVKAIHRNEVVVEELYADFYGAKKKRDVSMKLPTE